MKYSLDVLIDVKQIKKLMDKFYEFSGIGYALLDTDNNVLAKNGWQEICTKFHRINKRTNKNCIESDGYIKSHLKDGEFVGYKCKNGLMDYATPIIIYDEHVATLFFGQFFHKPPDIEYFKNQSKKYNFDEKEYLDALAKVPFVSEEEIKKIMSFYREIAGYIVSQAKDRIRNLENIEHEKEFIDKIKKQALFYDSILSKTTDAVWVTDKNDNIIYTNNALSKIAGIPKEEILNKNIYKDFEKGTIKNFIPYFNKAKKKLISVKYEEVLVITPSKRKSYQSGWLIPRMDNGVYKGMICTVTDVTEKKQAYETLAFSEEKYRTLFETIKQGILQTDINGKITFLNSGFANICGYKREELIGKMITDLFAGKDDKDNFSSRLTAILKEKVKPQPRNWKLLTKSGNVIITKVDWNYKKDKNGKVVGFVLVVSDVTKEILAEEEIKRNYANLKSVIENTDDIIVSRDLNFNAVVYNNAFEKIIKKLHGAEVTPGINTLEYLSKEEQQFWKEKIDKVIISKKKLQIDFNYVYDNGETRYYELKFNPILKDGEIIGITEINRDITDRKRIELELFESNQRLKQILESTKDILAVYDVKNGFLTYCKGVEKFGYKEKDIIGKPLSEILPNNNVSRIQKIFKEIVKTKNSYSEEFEFSISNKPLWLNVQFNPMLDEDGFVKSISIFARNITGKKELEKLSVLNKNILKILNKSIEEFDAVKEISLLVKKFTNFEAIGIRLKKGDDYPYYVTHGFDVEFVKKENYLCTRDIHGEIIRDAAGNPCLDCMCGNVILGKVDPALPFFTKGGSFWTNSTSELLASTSENERQGRTRNTCNEEGYESAALIPIVSEHKTIGLLQLNDRRKGMLSETIVRKFEDLCTSIGIALNRKKNNEERNKLLINLEKANKYKTEFIGNMSHEIRTPLTAILGFNELMIDDENLNDDQRENMLLIAKSGKRLMHLLMEVLDISRIETGAVKLTYEKCNIEDIIKDVYSLFSLKIKKKHVDFKYKIENIETFYTDQKRLNQILINLVGNALKFTEEGEITIDVSKDNDKVLFIVKDSGIGIKKEFIGKVFDYFSIAEEGYTKKYSGAGLGLTIVKKFVNMLGGKVWVESTYGKGAAFYFTLPVKKEIAEEAEDLEKLESREPEKQSKKLKICIIDDEEDILNLMVKILEKETKHETVVFSSCSKYLKTKKKSRKFDLIFVDIRMPEIDGINCLKKIRNKDNTVPVIALTALSLPSENEKIVKSGFTSFLPKPIEIKEIINVINRFAR